MSNSTKSKSVRQQAPKRGRPPKGTPRKYPVPGKPYKTFPMSPHGPSGLWQFRCNGKLHYVKAWGKKINGVMTQLPGDEWWRPALAEYERIIPALKAGRDPDADKPVLTVAFACNEFLTSKELKVEADELSPSSFHDYKRITDLLVKEWSGFKPVDDLTTRDFEILRSNLAKRYGPARLGTIVGVIRSIFKYIRKAEVVPLDFKKPTKKDLRKHRAKSPKKLFSAEEVRWLLDGKTDENGNHTPGADIHLRAMIFLGIGLGYGAKDCSELTLKHFDPASRVLAFPRPKTYIERRGILFDEAHQALLTSLVNRPTPTNKADADCFFITKYGNRWVRQNLHYNEKSAALTKVVNIDSVAQEFNKLCKRLGLNGRRGFYTLRHTFRTVADATRDFPACRLMMGHVDNSMDSVYVEEIGDDRLQAITQLIHSWLFER